MNVNPGLTILLSFFCVEILASGHYSWNYRVYIIPTTKAILITNVIQLFPYYCLMLEVSINYCFAFVGQGFPEVIKKGLPFPFINSLKAALNGSNVALVLGTWHTQLKQSQKDKPHTPEVPSVTHQRVKTTRIPRASKMVTDSLYYSALL